MGGTLEWSGDDKRFLEAVGRLIARGWRSSEKYVHYQQIHARLHTIVPDEYTEEDVERFCLRVFDMGGDGYMRLKRIYKRYEVRMLRADERLVRTTSGAASLASNAPPLDDAGITGGQSAVDDSELTPWLEALPDVMRMQAERQKENGKMSIPENGQQESDRGISRDFERNTDMPNVPDTSPKKPSRLRLAVAFIPVAVVAFVLVFVPLKIVAGFLGKMARKGHEKYTEDNR